MLKNVSWLFVCVSQLISISMKNLLIIKLFLSFGFISWFTLSTAFAQAATFTVATYNIRYDEKRDTANAWLNRLPHITALIQFHDFDIVGTQEGLHHQLKDLEQALDTYAYFCIRTTFSYTDRNVPGTGVGCCTSENQAVKC